MSRKKKQPAAVTGTVISLYDAACQGFYELVTVPGIAVLQSIGICGTQRIFKKYHYALGGPVLLKIDHSEIAVGKDIAAQILVKEVS